MFKCSTLSRLLRVGCFVVAMSQAALAQNAEAPAAITLTLPDGSKTTLAPGTIVRIRRALATETQRGAKTRIDWLQLVLVREAPEDVAELVGQSVPSLAKLVMPDGSPIWFNAGVAQGPMPLTTVQLRNGVRSGIFLRDSLQFLASTPEEVRQELSQKGGNALPEPQAVASLPPQGQKVPKPAQKPQEPVQKPEEPAEAAPQTVPPQQAQPETAVAQAEPAPQPIQSQQAQIQTVGEIIRLQQAQAEPAPEPESIQSQQAQIQTVGEISSLQQAPAEPAPEPIQPQQAQIQTVGEIIRLQPAEAAPTPQPIQSQLAQAEPAPQPQPAQAEAAPQPIQPQQAQVQTVGEIIRLQPAEAEPTPQVVQPQQAQTQLAGEIIRLQPVQTDPAPQAVQPQQAQTQPVGEIIRLQPAQTETAPQAVQPQPAPVRPVPQLVQPQQTQIAQAQPYSKSIKELEWLDGFSELAERTPQGRLASKQDRRIAEDVQPQVRQRMSRGLQPTVKAPMAVWDEEFLDILTMKQN